MSDLGICPLCGRPMIEGPSVDKHHWVPKSKGGDKAEWMHRVCHRMLHRTFDNTILARLYYTPDLVKQHPDIAKFVAWVQKKPTDFVDHPEPPGRYGRKRR